MQKQMNDRRMKINKIKHILNAMEESDNTIMAMIEGVMKLLQNKQGKVDNPGNKNEVSLSLYHYMCKNIVGSENHVNTIRLMNAVCDNVSRDKTRVDIASGSFGEGLQMLGSDLDIMWVLQFIEVHDTTTSKVVNPIKPYLSLTTDDTKPGFAICLHCSRNKGGNVTSDKVIKFNKIKTSIGVSNLPAIHSTGTFTVEIDGVYIIAVTVNSDTNDSAFEIYKNNTPLSRVYIQGKVGHNDQSGTSVVSTDLQNGDTVSVGSRETLHVEMGWSTLSIIKI
ncbi:unnamed protein product [Mytilus edulis]|uniref:C1q domain-containing protein n=1 Tax=Mytilus edulis TaxID=6550 RepID=A0A8S3RAJ4_MYTED|nr:unnamed protein product [Mytilus edulis]